MLIMSMWDVDPGVCPTCLIVSHRRYVDGFIISAHALSEMQENIPPKKVVGS